jgi:tripartite-type tricarboxylate transporter receptor subunit TctC
MRYRPGHASGYNAGMHRALVLCLLLATASGAWGQTYPTRPVRIIVSAAAGGPADVIGRVVAQKLGERLGQQFYVENVPAGAGNVAVGMVAKAAPDGYTLLSPTTSIVINPSLYANLTYDTLRDFAPVSLVAASPHVLTVNPSVPVKNVHEFIALVKANPGKFSYASPGTGTTGQLAGELFKLSLGLDLTHVPFNGAAPAVLSTIGGHTPIMFTALPSAAPTSRTAGCARWRSRAPRATRNFPTCRPWRSRAFRIRSPRSLPASWRRPAPPSPSLMPCSRRSPAWSSCPT